MLWFILSLLTALTVACRDVYVKLLSAYLSPLQIMAVELFWALPFLITGLLFTPLPPLDTIFWYNFALSLPAIGIAYYLYIIALASTPISLTLPLLAFTPAFIIISGFVVLGEQIDWGGGVGILLIVIGSYLLNIAKFKHGLWQPFLALIEEKGSRHMLIVAFIFSFAAVIGKKAILHSSAMFFSLSFFTFFNCCVLILLLLADKCSWKDLFGKNLKPGAILGSLLFAQVSLHGLAISISTAAYMIAIKRTSILFAVLMGWFFLKETNIKSRGAGTLLMFFGTLLISIYG